MPIRLKNSQVSLTLDLPTENYVDTRFDWTGKISEVRFQDLQITSLEKAETTDKPSIGRGFYNEFGIDAPVGYDEVAKGDWFPKIGIGLLKKEDGPYDFFRKYELRPADFTVVEEKDVILVECRQEPHNGYSYRLQKRIQLLESGFEIHYRLKNDGEKAISTNEYCHNFLGFGGDPMGPGYTLTFPFALNSENFAQTVNPEGRIEIGEREIRFNGRPSQQFFFSDLSGGQKVEAQWTLENRVHGIGISETLNVRTDSINLWGWGHVVSPELFFPIDLAAGDTREWTRSYELFKLV